MSILPLQSPGQALHAAAAAASAATVAKGMFANLLTAFRDEQATEEGISMAAVPTSAAATPGADASASSAATLMNAAQKLRGRVDSLLSGFHSGLHRLLSEKGVDLSGGVTLEADSLGSLRVVGDHPHKGIIETTLAAHPELVDLFRQVEADSSLLGALRRATASPQSGASAGLDLDSTAAAQGPLRVRVDGAHAICLTAGE